MRGTELFGALAACGARGFPIRLEVDDGEGFVSRQDANTEQMLLDPLALIARLGEEVRTSGVRTAMPAQRGGGEPRYYPLAVDESAPRLPAGSVVLTGTPEGVALATPDPLGLVARGALRLRGPFEQYRQEQLARAAAREPGGYLAPGDRMRARIAGLGTQIVRVAEPGAAPATRAAGPLGRPLSTCPCTRPATGPWGLGLDAEALGVAREALALSRLRRGRTLRVHSDARRASPVDSRR